MKVTKALVFLLAAAFGPQLAASGTNPKPNFFQQQLSVTEHRKAQAIVAEPEGGVAPLTPQHVTKWSSKSKVPKSVQFLLAALWVTMLCALPFILRSMDNKPVTKTQIIVGVLTLIVVLGGFWLFTNIILFQSIHFDRIRPLTVVECIYFMSQVITTVGYGDITPAKIRGQVFVGLYVLGALFIIAMLISDLTAHLIRRAQQYKEQRNASRAAEAGESSDGARPVLRRNSTVLEMIAPERPSLQPLFAALTVFGVLDLCWILFFSLHPGEGKTTFQALYMSVITLSSVGFGYFTPITEEGMIFGAFWMMFGSCALVNVISQFTALMVKLNEYERFRPEESSGEALGVLKEVAEGTAQVTESEFLRFSLVQKNLVKKKELDRIVSLFQNLHPQKGAVSLKVIEDSLKEEAPSS